MANKKTNPNFPFQHRTSDTQVSPLTHLEVATQQVNYISLSTILLFEPFHVDTPPFVKLSAMLDRIVELKGI